jgi:hypothetical protein
MDKKLSLFNSIASQLECKVILTGSTALKIYGLTNKDNIDLDIIVINPTENDKKLLSGLQTLCPISKYQGEQCKYLKEHKCEVKYQFTLAEINIDVFEENQEQFNNKYCLLVDYISCGIYNLKFVKPIMVNPIISIINAKIRFGRKKDMIDLLNMSRVFTNNL